jgi:hypothetical protein
LQEALMQCVSVEKTIAIMDRLYDIAINDPESSMCIAACKVWLDRAFGRPKQQIDVQQIPQKLKIPERDLTPEQREMLKATIQMLKRPR